jgi:hypothetical protein
MKIITERIFKNLRQLAIPVRKNKKKIKKNKKI